MPFFCAYRILPLKRVQLHKKPQERGHGPAKMNHKVLRFIRDYARKKRHLRRNINVSSSFITNNSNHGHSGLFAAWHPLRYTSFFHREKPE